MLSRVAFHGSGSYVSKSFNYILSQFKLDATTLDEKLLYKVSFARDVLNIVFCIENARSTSSLVKDDLPSLLYVPSKHCFI